MGPGLLALIVFIALDQNKQKLIDWLLAYAKKRDIMVELVEVNPTYPSISLKKAVNDYELA